MRQAVLPVAAAAPFVPAIAPFVVIGLALCAAFELLSNDERNSPTDATVDPKRRATVPTCHLRFTRKATADKVAGVFRGGPLSRADAVAALTSLGIGKSAAYEALGARGLFASNLEVLPDGRLVWKEAVATAVPGRGTP